jgi:hypothetical protein
MTLVKIMVLENHGFTLVLTNDKKGSMHTASGKKNKPVILQYFIIDRDCKHWLHASRETLNRGQRVMRAVSFWSMLSMSLLLLHITNSRSPAWRG